MRSLRQLILRFFIFYFVYVVFIEFLVDVMFTEALYSLYSCFMYYSCSFIEKKGAIVAQCLE